MDDLEVLIRARYPILYLLTWEEDRADERLMEAAKKLNKKAWAWSITRGMHVLGAALDSKGGGEAKAAEPLAMLNEIVERSEPAIFVLKDFHAFLNDPTVVRRLRELSGMLRQSFKSIVIVSPRLAIPMELEKDITVLDMALPCDTDIEKLLSELQEQAGKRGDLKVDLGAADREKLVKACLGLTLREAENVLARVFVTQGKLDASAVDSVLSEKKQIIRKSGVLEYYEHKEGLEGLGGMEPLKAWLAGRQEAFSDKARDFGLPSPKGILLLGVQGCGKSLCAKTIAAAWRQPLLRLDAGALFGSLVGSSEESMRKAIRTAESIAPAVMWVDEIEKAFAGVQSSNFSDAGTTARVFGTLLTWLQEKTKPVFVVATANNITQLPPELLRKGRFDEIFFVDLPKDSERRDIFSLHLAKRGRKAGGFDMAELAKNSEGFSGAEIEQALVSGLHEAFRRKRELETGDIVAALKATVPLSVTMAEPISAMRAWASSRARPAS